MVVAVGVGMLFHLLLGAIDEIAGAADEHDHDEDDETNNRR